MLVYRLRTCLALWFCYAFTVSAFAAQDCAVDNRLSYAQVNEDHFLIAVMRVNNRTVAESVELYKHQDTYLIPVKQLGFLFNLDWVFTEALNQKEFYSDYQRNTPHSFCEFSFRFTDQPSDSPYVWYEDDFETYIDVNLVAILLQGEIEFNPQRQQLSFSSAYEGVGYTSKNQLPIFAKYTETEIEEHPVVRSQYQMFSSPLVNYNITVKGKNQGDMNYRSNLNAFFDLFHLATELRVNASQNTSQQYLKFSKNIINSDLDQYQLASVQSIDDRALKYEFGDISIDGDELLRPARLAMGAQLFSYSQNTRRNFSSIRIEETALPGWRAILFRNGQFISEQTVADNGLIVFENVNTFYGVNTFRMHLYGPQGEEEFREKIVHVGNQQKQASEFDFSFSASDASKSLFNEHKEQKLFDRQVEANVSYGLSDKLTLNAQWLEMPDNKENQRFISTAADYANFNSLFRVKYAKGEDKGHALFAGINTNFNEYLSSNISYRYFDDFKSELYQQSQALKQELQVRALSRIVPWQMGLNFNFTEKQYVDQAVQRTLGIQTNQFLFGGSFSNEVQYHQNGDKNSLSYRIFTTNTINNWQIRQSLSFEPSRKKGVSTYSANIRWPQKGKVFNETKFDYKANRSAKYSLGHRLSWQTDYFNLQLGASVDDKKHWQFTLGISGSLYKSKQSNAYQFARHKGNSVRRIEAIAFIDENRDGEFNEEEQTLQNIEFSGQAAWRKSKSNEQGLAELFTQSDYQKISIEQTSLSDPFLASEQNTKIVASHIGSITSVYFPLSPVNDVEGEVSLLDGESVSSILGLNIQLSNAEQDQFFYAQTDSEGYFFFQKVPPGTYTLSIDEEQLHRLNIDGFTPIKVVASEHGDIISLQTIQLHTQNNADTRDNIPDT